MPKGILLSRFPPAQYFPEEIMQGYDNNGELAGGYSMVGHVPNETGLCLVWVDVSNAVTVQIKNNNDFVVIGIVGKDADISAVSISNDDQTRIKNYFINRGFDEDVVNNTDISNGWKFVKAAGKLLGVSPQEVRNLLEAEQE